MPERVTVTRDAIVEALVSSLRPLRYVHALWEGGSAAFGHVDRWSDLDLYILVDKARVASTFSVVERTLRSISLISLTYEVESGFEGVFQKFYRLRDVDEFTVIDLAILTPGSPEMFLAPEIHGTNVFHFNKGGAAKVRPVDRVSLARRRRKRLQRITLRFETFNNYVVKNLGRGHTLEALEDYRTVTLATLIEALRMKFSPMHFDFRMHYVDSELPPGIVKRLRRLSYVRDTQDLERKYKEATDWCREILGLAATV
ncbi:MAG TPA: hypothetical protein VKF39_00985 [Nitrososphaerales archaeon]|nr:hypothetical protein [Nitrososphaerales archaeon]